MSFINFDYSNATSFLNENEMNNYHTKVKLCLENLETKYDGYLGWLDYPIKDNDVEVKSIKQHAKKIQDQSDVFIVIGIGGSYLGAKAAIEMLRHTFFNDLSDEARKAPKIYFAGNNMSSTYLNELFDVIKDKDVTINVISKSGTTTEPAIAFRVFKKYMEEKYGKQEARKRIFVTTDPESGALKKLAIAEGYTSFIIPKDMGGRYSVLSAVGLLPVAVAGLDIEKMLEGAKLAYHELESTDINNNPAYQYAILRNILYHKGKTTELLAYYEPKMQYFAEWWKQLFGESEGKDQKGIFPASVGYTTDLHSIGQYVQDGVRNLFETIIHIEEPKYALEVVEQEDDSDGLNYLAGKSLHMINVKAMEGTIYAHVEGEVPNMVIKVPKIDEFTFGYLVYFFEKACAVSGSLLDVNPFDQPGVEQYKSNMFALLGKPGYEEAKSKLEKFMK